jgi:hypothetical protein
MLASRVKIIDRPAELVDRDPLSTSPLIHGVFEPPSGFALTAIARHKLLIGLVVLLCVGVGIAYGVSRAPSYTASATLQVGQVNPNSPGFYGYVQSAAALASAFGRAIAAEPVLEVVQHKLNLPPAVASARLSAEPIPVSPAFRVFATGPSGAAAIALANVTAGALIEYESKSNSANPQAATLLHEYGDASFALQRVNDSLARLERDKHASQQARGRAAAERTAAQVKLKAIGNSYVSTVTSQAPRSGLVTLLAGATSASSDRKSKIEMFGFIGLLSGLVIGCLAAPLRERRARRRATTRPADEPQAASSR